MPGGDRTGPNGLGPATGRRAGFCSGYSVPGYANPAVGGRGGRGLARGFGMGMGMGMGRQRGWRNRSWWGGFFPRYRGVGAPAGYGANGVVSSAPAGTASAAGPAQELELLKGQAEHIEQVLDGLRSRIGDLEAQAATQAEKQK